MRKSYSGIGSRSVPENIQEQIFRLSIHLAERQYVLRSGAADGCDSAFEVGCDSVGGEKEIYLPWKNFNKHTKGIDTPTVETYKKAQKIAAKFHPSWKYLKPYAKKFHTRNVYQVLGRSLTDPVKFVICYTHDGGITGGTGQAMRIARGYNIPIFNLYFEETYNNIIKLLNEKHN